MLTLSPHLPVLATTLSIGHIASVHPAAAVQLAAQTAGGPTTGVLVLIVTVLAAAGVRALRSAFGALHDVFALLARFVQLAAAMATILVVVLLVIIMAVAVAVHH